MPRDCAIILSFFAPVHYELPAKHFQRVAKIFAGQGAQVVATQATMPGQRPQPLPAGVVGRVYETRSMLWHKERLWNLGARLTNADYLFFVDADVLFSNGNWLSQSKEALKTHDVIQPYSLARWLDRGGQTEMERPAFVSAIIEKQTPRLNRYHPGFAWGMTRKAFEETGGFFDGCVSGNGDSFFALCLQENEGVSRVYNWLSKNQEPGFSDAEFISYRRKVLGLSLNVGMTPGDLLHLWHGDRANRQYTTRSRIFEAVKSAGHKLVEGNSGLIEWDCPEKCNQIVAQYFHNKRDDG